MHYVGYVECFFKRNRTPLKSSKGLEGAKRVYTTIYHSKWQSKRRTKIKHLLTLYYVLYNFSVVALCFRHCHEEDAFSCKPVLTEQEAVLQEPACKEEHRKIKNHSENGSRSLENKSV
ncbi:hypothetical protein AV530_006057 [Patagioenas fasciata monilis]|uniref:Uncharacterized protein n=1 Tax=Patagioenas fasciata monilis TaxID=372326 RepID=A0A1V4J8Q8_PATFA|nr:hypothetical protein AV530_006057 [Patagioenas fasciata monilis]